MELCDVCRAADRGQPHRCEGGEWCDCPACSDSSEQTGFVLDGDGKVLGADRGAVR